MRVVLLAIPIWQGGLVMLQHSQRRLQRQVHSHRQHVAETSGLPFGDLLCPRRVQQVIDEEEE